jgi:hypothetical protein
MKQLDFGAQTLFLILTIFNLLYVPEDKYPKTTLTGNLGLGILSGLSFLCFAGWQMISSLVSCLVLSPLYKKKVLHLALALLYFITLHSISTLRIVIPYGLGVYYYILTCIWCFHKGNDVWQ